MDCIDVEGVKAGSGEGMVIKVRGHSSPNKGFLEKNSLRKDFFLT